MDTSALRPRVSRRAFVSRLLAATPDALVITGVGSAAYDVFAAGDRDRNYYLWGAMGGAASIGLGLALAQPDQSVVVITGDGEQLMGIGSLGTIAVKQPKNLTIVVLDNGHYDLIVDLTHTTYINSGGLRCLVSAWRRAKAAQGSLSLCGLNERLQEIFTMVGFDKVFTIHEDCAGARQVIRPKTRS